MNERIKQLRKELNLTQEEFASKLGIKRGALANYEIGRNEPIDAVLRLICTTFNVNEAWLRTGEGEMFLKLSRNDEIAAYIASIMKDEDAELQRFLIQLMSRIPSDCWSVIEEKAREIAGDK